MFIHSSCGSTLYADLTKKFRILVSIGIGSRTLKTGMGSIIPIQNNGSAIDTPFYCTICSKDVPIEEVSFTCTHCGKPFSINLLERLKLDGRLSSTIVCKFCKESLTRSGVLDGRKVSWTNLTEFVSKISFGEE